MDILIDKNNRTVAIGIIEFGIFDEDFEKWKVELNGQMYYIIDNDYICVEVEDDSIPNENIIYKYCYTKEAGFYVNPDYSEPINLEKEVERLTQENINLKSQLDIMQEALDFLAMQ